MAHIPTLIERIGCASCDSRATTTTPVPVTDGAYIVFVYNRHPSATPTIPTVTGTGGWAVTWTQGATIVDTSDRFRCTIFSGKASSTTAGEITADFASVTQTAAIIDVQFFAEGDGDNIIVQSVGNVEGSNPATATLAAFADAANTSVMGSARGAGSLTFTALESGTKLGTRASPGGGSLSAVSMFEEGDGDLTPTGDWSGSGVTANVAAEIGVAAAGSTAALTGSITAATDETDIVAGAKEIILTLTGDTWVAVGAVFDAERQAIIDGMDAAASPALGWNAEVRDKEVVGAVVRTSDTVVTITLTASALYNITVTETITVTVPASALVTSGSPVVASPTFTVAAVGVGNPLVGPTGAPLKGPSL